MCLLLLLSFISLLLFVGDVLPPLTRIFSPLIRPINPRLFSMQEKNALQRLIALHKYYKLSFIKKRVDVVGVSSRTELQLEPPLDLLISSFTKHNKELAKRATTSSSQQRGTTNTLYPFLSQMQRQTVHHASMFTTTEPKKEQSHPPPTTTTTMPKPKKPPTQRRDFFGRVIDVDNDQSDTSNNYQSKTKVYRHQHPVHYKFHEGATNAVRRKVTMKCFL